MIRLLLVVFLAGCASPAPTTYNQGAYRPARPPVFHPVEDAPHTIGQPGRLRRPELERGKDKRVLPATAEPGVWAGDQPRAATHPETGEPLPDDPILFGVRLPFASEAQTETGRLATRLCAFHMNIALGLAPGVTHARRLNDFEKECIAAKLYAHCAEKGLADYQNLVKATKRLDEVIMNRARNTDRAARQFKESKCNRLPALENPYNSIDEVVEQAVKIWDRGNQ